MKIELKNIQYSKHLSEETNAFSANLYINGYKAGVASNQRHGGSTNYIPFNVKGRQLISEAEAWCRTLPPEKFEVEGKELIIEMNLENFIDNLLSTYLEQKELQKFRTQLEKAAENSIIIGVPDQSFRTLSFKFPIKIFLADPHGVNILKEAITQKVIPNLKEGEVILNANIPEQILRDGGLRKEQYVTDAETLPKATTK